jgi:hypothetical protein
MRAPRLTAFLFRSQLYRLYAYGFDRRFLRRRLV